jgi:hypothetical protein
MHFAGAEDLATGPDLLDDVKLRETSLARGLVLTDRAMTVLTRSTKSSRSRGSPMFRSASFSAAYRLTNALRSSGR